MWKETHSTTNKIIVIWTCQYRNMQGTIGASSAYSSNPTALQNWNRVHGSSGGFDSGRYILRNHSPKWLYFTFYIFLHIFYSNINIFQGIQSLFYLSDSDIYASINVLIIDSISLSQWLPDNMWWAVVWNNASNSWSHNAW